VAFALPLIQQQPPLQQLLQLRQQFAMIAGLDAFHMVASSHSTAGYAGKHVVCANLPDQLKIKIIIFDPKFLSFSVTIWKLFYERLTHLKSVHVLIKAL